MNADPQDFKTPHLPHLSQSASHKKSASYKKVVLINFTVYNKDQIKY